MARQKGSSRKAQLEAERKAKQRKQRILFGTIAAAVVIVGVGAFLFMGNSQGDAPAAATGPVAPDFELAAVTGEPVSLSDYRGQPVAVTFMHSW